MEVPKLYRTLGLREGASIEEIKSAYRSLVKQYHPDISKDPSTGEMFKRVVAAYKTLTVMERKKTIINSEVRSTSAPRRRPPKEVDIHGLGKLLLEGFTPEMRAFAARRLGHSGKRSAYAYLRKALYDSSEQVLCAVVEAVGRLKIVQSSGELASLFSRGGRTLRIEILEAVQHIGCHPAFDHILAMGCSAAEPAVRRRAGGIVAQFERDIG